MVYDGNCLESDTERNIVSEYVANQSKIQDETNNNTSEDLLDFLALIAM